MVNNKIYIIECKTCKMDETRVVNSYIDKLMAKKELGGLKTKVCLVSYQDLKPASKNYAEECGVEVISGGELAQLQFHLQNWIGK